MFRMQRFLLDAGGTGADAGGNGGASANTGTPPASGGSNQGAGTSEAKFTQGDVDRIIGERYARLKADATADVLKALGVDKLDDAAAAIKAKQQADEASKTELQKAADARAKAEKDAADAKAALDAEKRARITDRRNSAISVAAVGAGAIDAGDVLAWAERSGGDTLAKTVREDGAIDDAAVKKLIDAALKDKPHFFKPAGQQRTPGSPSNAGGGRASAADETRKRFGDGPLVNL